MSTTDRSCQAIIDSYDPATPLPQASTPPSSWYTVPEVYSLEQQTVFTNSWQMIGRANDLYEPGRYVTFEVAGEPIVVVRGQDGVLRGFFNVCRHHAAAVVTKSAGIAQHLRCPYHGWTYSLEGALIGTPDFAGVCNFDSSANRLMPVTAAQWQSWVFVTLDPDACPLEEFLGDDLIGEFAGLDAEQLQWVERRSYFLNCNWKVFVDNYLDGGYHVPHIHRSLNGVLDYHHYTIDVGKRFCLQSSPLSVDSADGHTGGVRKGKRARYYWIYPNFMINLYDEVMDTNLVMPRGVDRTEVIFDYYFKNTAQQQSASIATSEEIQNEDVAICESVQHGLGSRAYNAGRLSVRREAGEHLFHKLLYRDLKSRS
jgi:phenylpropionate dioxygenase-like ring-hydroxylating dioxygenase large terminal subunit